MRGCFRVALGLLSTGLLMISAVGSRAQSAAKEKGFEAYRLVQTRNVFDPNRRAPRGEEQRRSGPPRSRNDSFTLTGTMVTEGKTLAFFSGSRSEFSRVIPVGESVGDFKVKAIEAAQVELEHDGKATTLAIGRTVQLEGTGAPDGPETAEESAETPPETGVPAPTPDASPPGGSRPPGDQRPFGDSRQSRDSRQVGDSRSPSGPSSSPSGSTPSNDKNEVLRRMMERRQQEMSK